MISKEEAKRHLKNIKIDLDKMKEFIEPYTSLIEYTELYNYINTPTPPTATQNNKVISADEIVKELNEYMHNNLLEFESKIDVSRETRTTHITMEMRDLVKLVQSFFINKKEV